jgi:tetratricopeptide (TPR) repeat protein
MPEFRHLIRAGLLAFLPLGPSVAESLPPSLAADLAAVPKNERPAVSGWVTSVLASAEAKGPTHEDTRALLAKIVPLGLRYDPEEDEVVGGPNWQPPRLDVVFELCDHCLGRDDPLTRRCLEKLIAHPVLVPLREQVFGPASDAALGMMMAVAGRARTQDQVLEHAARASHIVARSPLYRHPSNRVSAAKLSLLWRAPVPAVSFTIDNSKLFENALKEAETKHGPDHPETLVALDHWALYLSITGDSAKAADYLQRIVDSRTRSLGPEHADTLTAIDNLGWCHHAAGHLDKAAPFLQTALAGRQKTLSADHPDTLLSHEHIAGLKDSQGDRAAAQVSLQSILSTREKTLGANHALTLKSLVNLADFHFANGDFDQAEPLYLQAQKARLTTFGPAHPDTLSSQDDLAEIQLARGDLPKAKESLLLAASARAKSTWDFHAESAILTHLAALLCQQGDFAQAESKLELAIGCGSVGLNTPRIQHPALARSTFWRAVAAQGVGDKESALRYATDAHASIIQFLGAAHPWAREAQSLIDALAR